MSFENVIERFHQNRRLVGAGGNPKRQSNATAQSIIKRSGNSFSMQHTVIYYQVDSSQLKRAANVKVVGGRACEGAFGGWFDPVSALNERCYARYRW